MSAISPKAWLTYGSALLEDDDSTAIFADPDLRRH